MKIQNFVTSIGDDDLNLGMLIPHFSYEDDGYITTQHEQLLKSIDVPSSADAMEGGLHLSLTKCMIFWRPAPPHLGQSL